METVRIQNIGPQRLPLQVSPPKGDFYLTQQQIHLGRNKSVELPVEVVHSEQIKNLQAKGLIRVISGTLE